MNRTPKLFALLATILSIITAIIFLEERYINEPAEIAGNWEMKFMINESSYKPYIGKSMTFKLYFIQKENEIEGKGEKWWIDDKEISIGQHDQMELKGTIDGDIFTCTYTLHGTRRVTTGIIEAEISNNTKSMNGTFSGTAADTKGLFKGVKK